METQVASSNELSILIATHAAPWSVGVIEPMLELNQQKERLEQFNMLVIP